MIFSSVVFPPPLGPMIPRNSRGPISVNFRSPLLWDVFAVNTYLTISVLFFLVGLIPDIAIARDRSRHAGLKARLAGSAWADTLGDSAAFTRRLDMIIDFPAPDERSRLSIWQHCLRPPVPVEDGLDLEFCARSFTMSGGNIRSAATTAGYLAAGADKSIGMAELIAAIFSPGLDGAATLPSIDISNGGQHRY